MSDPISNPPVSPEEIKAFYAANPQRATPLTAKEETPPTWHVHVCANPTSQCQARGYCECECGSWRPSTGSWTSTRYPRSQPSSSSEITEAIDDFAEKCRAAWNCFGTNPKYLAEVAARSRLESLYLEQLQEIERLRRPFVCGVCGGSGKPTSGLPCICGGIGTEQAETHGLRVECFRLEAENERLSASLKDSQLTAEEAEAAWQFWSYGATRGNHSDIDGRPIGPVPGPLTPYINAMGRATRKLNSLRALSTKGTAEK